MVAVEKRLIFKWRMLGCLGMGLCDDAACLKSGRFAWLDWPCSRRVSSATV